jgi:hypothetical protein
VTRAGIPISTASKNAVCIEFLFLLSFCNEYALDYGSKSSWKETIGRMRYGNRKIQKYEIVS